MSTETRRIRRLLELVLTIIQKDMKVKYKNTVLGYLWSLALPIAQALVFFMVFKMVIRIPVENYLLFVLSGLFVWQWFANAAHMSTFSFLGNVSIIKKIRFERSTLVLSTCSLEMIHFLLTLPVLAVIMYLHGKHLSWIWIVEVPLLLIAQVMLIFGVSLIVGSVNVFFRDLERIIVVVLMIMFYVTPVIYPTEMVPEQYQWLLQLNPVAVLVEAWRKMVLEAQFATELIALSWLYGAISLAVGLWVYSRLQWRFAEVL